MKGFGTIALATLLGLGVVACSDDTGSNGNINEKQTGSIQSNPGQLVFSDVALGQSATQTVRISNAGTGTLRITSIELIEDTDGDEGGVEFQRDKWVNSAELATDEVHRPFSGLLAARPQPGPWQDSHPFERPRQGDVRRGDLDARA
ncbi:MAG: hypothetical protein R3E66_01735 [bacterium]